MAIQPLVGGVKKQGKVTDAAGRLSLGAVLGQNKGSQINRDSKRAPHGLPAGVLVAARAAILLVCSGCIDEGQHR